VATDQIAKRFGGVDSLVVYADGDRPNASADAAPIKAMEYFERHLKIETNLGASVSLVPFLRTSWQINHYGDPKWYFVPEHSGTVHTMIFQLQQNGAPGFLRPYMTDDGRKANIGFFYPDHTGETVAFATHHAEEFIAANPMGAISIRLDPNRSEPGAPWWSAERVKDFVYYMIGPLLPARAHTLNVQRKEGGDYVPFEVRIVARDGLPPWIEEFRKAAHEKYAKEAKSRRPGRVFNWPGELEDWQASDVDQWFENEELRIRAVSVDTKDLIVDDQKSMGSAPTYQPTKSWTRGVQLILAGGPLGMLAAINDEVERGHLANISLILLVIFVLHSVTYRSAVSGGIIFLQLATATLLSLAFMAVRGVGLNINTLPVQAVGVGIGVDYAIYIVDRIRQEMALRGDLDDAIRTAVRTTGMAVTFTGTTVVGGIGFWVFSDLRFQAEMAQLLIVLMAINMVAAVTLVPALYSILRPGVASSLQRRNQAEARAEAAAEEAA
jgi:predicted RND superfamily exporter protein